MMPSGGNTPISDEEMKSIWRDYEQAKKNGLVYEWLQWFVGGVTIDRLPPAEASYAACIEWDF
jgi:hypothetical protein